MVNAVFPICTLGGHCPWWPRLALLLLQTTWHLWPACTFQRSTDNEDITILSVSLPSFPQPQKKSHHLGLPILNPDRVKNPDPPFFLKNAGLSASSQTQSCCDLALLEPIPPWSIKTQSLEAPGARRGTEWELYLKLPEIMDFMCNLTLCLWTSTHLQYHLFCFPKIQWIYLCEH